uniref:Uncharacterized protein n=1 Tax=Arion vulgaris TaxID=1028688 RepID=A0A0B6ZHA5_9EUPU
MFPSGRKNVVLKNENVALRNENVAQRNENTVLMGKYKCCLEEENERKSFPETEK